MEVRSLKKKQIMDLDNKYLFSSSFEEKKTLEYLNNLINSRFIHNNPIELFDFTNEALGCEKIISLFERHFPEIVKDGYTGILVPPRDSDALARAIIDLSKDKKKVELMGGRARKIAEELFSIEANVKKTEQVYESLLKNGK